MRVFLLFILVLPLSLKAQGISYVCAGGDPALVEVSLESGFEGTPPYTYNWSGPGGFTSTSASVSLSTPGVYQMTITDANNCPAFANHTVIQEAAPTLAITANNTCVGSAQTVSVTGVPSGYGYSWTFGSGSDPSSSTSAFESVLWTTTGTKTIDLTISKAFTGSGGGCSATCSWDVSKTITVSQLSGIISCTP